MICPRRNHVKASRSHVPGLGSKRLAAGSYGLALVLSLLVPPTLRSQVGTDRQQEIQAHAQKAQEALKSGNPSAADREFRAILALDPNNADARGNLGVIHFFQADWAGAAEQFRQVLKFQPNL